MDELKSGTCFYIGETSGCVTFGDIVCFSFSINGEMFIICKNGNIFSKDKFIEYCKKNKLIYKGEDYPYYGLDAFIHRVTGR